MEVVKFNSVEEFLKEMVADHAGEVIDRDLVRVTQTWRESSYTPNIHHIAVVATYVVQDKVGEKMSRQLVRLDRPVGDIMQSQAGRVGEVSEKTARLADEISEYLQQAIEAEKLTCRTGVIEPMQDGKDVKPR